MASELDGLDEDEEARQVVNRRLEMLGYRVGQGLVEKFSRDKPRFVETLDIIKFICKDLWTILFRKQIDNLKTNHRGTYVLTDHSFKWFRAMSTEAGGQETVNRAQPYAWFPCGVLRGALTNLGLPSTVTPDITTLPLPAMTMTISTTKDAQ